LLAQDLCDPLSLGPRSSRQQSGGAIGSRHRVNLRLESARTLPTRLPGAPRQAYWAISAGTPHARYRPAPRCLPNRSALSEVSPTMLTFLPFAVLGGDGVLDGAAWRPRGDHTADDPGPGCVTARLRRTS